MSRLNNCCKNKCECCEECERYCKYLINDVTNKNYDQYGVASNPPSNSFLQYFKLFGNGNLTYIENDTSIILVKGYVYSISYIFLATPEVDNYYQIVPYINDSARLLYAAFAPANVRRNVSASGSFITNEALSNTAKLQFSITYPPETRNIDISGAISIIPIAR